MSYWDWAWEQALANLHDEAMLERAKREQVIFLFVEGESEEIAFPLLLESMTSIDLQDLGVLIANYNGRGNLRSALRLLRLTLSHTRPVIITYDNDPDSLREVEKCRREGLLDSSTPELPVPTKGIIVYPNGHVGGSFEESFPVDHFISTVFSSGLIPRALLEKKEAFALQFRADEPWLAQVKKFTADNGYPGFTTKKTDLAKALATRCPSLPSTYQQLAQLVLEVRNRHPVIHPTDVDLPKVHGLTYFPGKKAE